MESESKNVKLVERIREKVRLAGKKRGLHSLEVLFLFRCFNHPEA